MVEPPTLTKEKGLILAPMATRLCAFRGAPAYSRKAIFASAKFRHKFRHTLKLKCQGLTMK